MSETAPPLHDHDAPLARPRKRARTAWIVTVVLAVAAVAIGIVVARSGSSHYPPAAGSFRARRDQAVDRLLQQRSQALVLHDRARFLATLDPTEPGFDRRQLALFDATGAVRFSDWSYSVTQREGPGSGVPPGTAASLHAAAVYRPVGLTEHYEIARFDRRPTDGAIHATFIDRDDRWWISAIGPASGAGAPLSVDLWDLGPVSAVHARHVLVLGPPSERATMRSVAAVAVRSIPRVTAVWGPRWARRAVFEVPASQRELGRLTGASGNLGPIAALTSAEIHSTGRAEPVADRVAVNPANWPRLSRSGRLIVITHELTHVASRADTGARTPKWVSEGLADYVGFRDSGVPVAVAAGALARRDETSGLPRTLPANGEFSGSAARLAVAYDEAWLACALIAKHWGVPRLLAFYRAVGTSSAPSAVATAYRAVLHTTTSGFLTRWRAFLSAQLG